MVKNVLISKYLPLIIFMLGFLTIVFLVIFLSVNKKTPSKFEFDEYVMQDVSDINKDIKIRVYELCSDQVKSDECKYAIDQCDKNQSCQNMVTAYQLAKNKTPELNNSAFINASKEYINLTRAQMGLPLLK